ncbi:MAG: AAA family ATPase [Clostridia bacterium]|nr:AAA family ATPase [Clostridia bacterium]
MLTRFEVENYKNFKDRLVLDFSDAAGYKFNEDCIIGEVLGKIIICGRNATGKTNLCRAISDIRYGRPIMQRFDAVSFLNADSDRGRASFSYEFKFGTDRVTYCYKKTSPSTFVHEKLEINGECVFELNHEKAEFDKLNLELIEAEHMNLAIYLEELKTRVVDEISAVPSFLMWLFANGAYSEGSAMKALRYYIQRISVLSAPVFVGALSIRRGFNSESEVRGFEKFLNEMGINCKLQLEQLPDGGSELYVIHEKRKIPFEQTASSGTRTLARIYSIIDYARNRGEPSLLMLDEFDAFFHYELSERIIRYLKSEMPRTQIVLTTHDTNLMSTRLMRPDCLFILSRDGRITPLMKATKRELREGHNLEKMYISGEFADYE